MSGFCSPPHRGPELRSADHQLWKLLTSSNYSSCVPAGQCCQEDDKGICVLSSQDAATILLSHVGSLDGKRLEDGTKQLLQQVRLKPPHILQHRYVSDFPESLKYASSRALIGSMSVKPRQASAMGCDVLLKPGDALFLSDVFFAV